MDSPSYKPFKDNLLTIVDGLHLQHVEVTPFPPTVLSKAPVVEMLTLHEATEELLTENLREFAKKANESNVEGFVPLFFPYPTFSSSFIFKSNTPQRLHGVAYGPTVEEIVKHTEQSASPAVAPAKAGVLFVGWESKEAHMRFRETEDFKNSIPLVRGNNRDREVWHVKLNKF